VARGNNAMTRGQSTAWSAARGACNTVSCGADRLVLRGGHAHAGTICGVPNGGYLRLLVALCQLPELPHAHGCGPTKQP
jgi:hypothetical protein